MHFNNIKIPVDPVIGILQVALQRLERGTVEETQACIQTLESLIDMLSEYNAEQNPTLNSVAWLHKREELL